MNDIYCSLHVKDWHQINLDPLSLMTKIVLLSRCRSCFAKDYFLLYKVRKLFSAKSTSKYWIYTLVCKRKRELFKSYTFNHIGFIAFDLMQNLGPWSSRLCEREENLLHKLRHYKSGTGFGYIKFSHIPHGRLEDSTINTHLPLNATLEKSLAFFSTPTLFINVIFC